MDYKRSLKKSAAKALSGDLPIDTKVKVCISGQICIEMLVLKLCWSNKCIEMLI